MANQWFRLYSEFAHDPKVQSMPEVMQRRLLMLMCMKCDGSVTSLDQDEMLHALRITENELADTKALFIKKGFIDEKWDVLNWDKRQYVTDRSAERTKAYRERKKAATDDVTVCDVTVTPPDTEQKQNRTETSIDKSISVTDVPSANPKPKKRAERLKEDFIPPDSWLEFAQTKSLTEQEAGQEWAKFRDHHLSKGTLLLDWNAGWRTWVRNSVQFKMERQTRENRGRAWTH